VSVFRSLLVITVLGLSAPVLAGPLEVWPAPRAVVPDDNGNLAFDLVVVNASSDDATDVVVTDQLVEGAELVSAQPPAVVEGQTLRWSLGTVAPGGEARIRLVVRGGPDRGARVEARLGTPRARTAEPVLVIAPDEFTAFLAPTLDADAADPEVLALAAELRGDPLAIHAFVRDQVAYQPYRGSLRGARGTIWAGAGNSLDRASLLVALLRASGVPARYGSVTLGTQDAAALIASGLPAPINALSPGLDRDAVLEALTDRDVLREQTGAVIADTIGDLDPSFIAEALYPDPTQDAGLLAVARNHTVVQMRMGDSWVTLETRDAEPSTPVLTFAEVDDSQRHKVTITVRTQSFNPVFGVSGLDEADLVTATVATVELAGRPVVVRNDVVGDALGGLVFNTVTWSITPEIVVGGQTRARGAAAVEVYSDFPAGTQVMTGYFIDARVTSPDEDDFTYRHTVVDRLGEAYRGEGFPGGGDEELVVFDVDEGPDPSVLPGTVTTLHVAGGYVPGRAAAAASSRLRAAQARLGELAPLLLDNVEQEGDEPRTPAALVLHAEASRLVEAGNGALADFVGNDYLAASDRFGQALAEAAGVLSFAGSPRLVFVASRVHERGPEVAIDLARTDLRTIAPASVGSFGVFAFRTSSSALFSSLEGLTLESLGGGANLVDGRTVFQAAREQGIATGPFTQNNAQDLRRLDIPRDARTRMLSALAAGRQIYAPFEQVLIGGNPRYVWLEYDPGSGRIETVDANGMHPALLEYTLPQHVASANLGFNLGALVGFTFTFVSFTGLLQNPKQAGAGNAAGAAAGGIAGALTGCFAPSPITPAVPGAFLAVGAAFDDPNLPGLVLAGISTLIAAGANIPPKTGWPIFIQGFNVGLCAGTLSASVIIAGVLASKLVGDPPLPTTFLAVPRTPLGPPVTEASSSTPPPRPSGTSWTPSERRSTPGSGSRAASASRCSPP
jgi:uncharacterized repeat protein (TIGR01451 family)